MCAAAEDRSPTPKPSSTYITFQEKLTNPENNWEDLALILYDRSQSGGNPREAQALYDSLNIHKQELVLSESDLENKLIRRIESMTGRKIRKRK